MGFWPHRLPEVPCRHCPSASGWKRTRAPRWKSHSKRGIVPPVLSSKPSNPPVLPCPLVEWLLPRRVVRCVDDVHDLWSDPPHHDLEPVSQSHLRGRASLAPATHGDKEVSVPHVDNGNLPAVGRDGTVDLSVQEFLNNRTNLGVGAPPRTCGARGLEYGRHPCDELRTDDRSDPRFECGPRGA